MLSAIQQIIYIYPPGNFLMTILDNMLRSFKFKGYPIVSSLSDMNLVGYAGRAELAYSLSTSILMFRCLNLVFNESLSTLGF